MPTIFRLDVCWIANAKSAVTPKNTISGRRSEEHTSELQSRSDLVCRLLLEKKKNKYKLQSRSELVYFLLLKKQKITNSITYKAVNPVSSTILGACRVELTLHIVQKLHYNKT